VRTSLKTSPVGTVQGISYHTHHHIEVDLYQDGRRKGVEVEKLDRFGDEIFHPPAPGVIRDKEFQGDFKIIRDEKSWFFMAIAPDNNLA